MRFFRRKEPREMVVMEKSQLKRETRTRKIWALISSFLFLIAIIFLILVEVGQTSTDTLNNVYFLKLDLSNIVPTSVPNYRLINTIAQTLGLHDFYQVGLWNYCAGYKNQGITYCSDPKTLFWFNPIAVIQSELLAGASSTFVENYLFNPDDKYREKIKDKTRTHAVSKASHAASNRRSPRDAWTFRNKDGSVNATELFAPPESPLDLPFPSEVQNVLHILKTASQWMFGLFLTGAVLSFVSIFVAPLAIFSKLASIPVVIFTFLAALTTTVAAVLGTVIFIIFRNAATGQTQINLGANIGTEMYAFMWVAAGSTLIAFVIQLCLLCCCRSRRKAKKEWRKSHSGAVGHSSREMSEKDEESVRGN